MEDEEIGFWRKKLLGSLIFTAPIVLLMINQRLFDIEFLMSNEKIMTFIMLILALPVIFFFGFSIIKSGVRGLFTLYFNMDSLIALGTIVAFITGIFSLFTSIIDYSGVSAMIMSLFITGKYIESKARGRATSEIMKLLELGAKKARVLRNKVELEIDISDLKVGDIMIVKPGEKIPTDGLVVRGESAVDESMVNGESMPTEKKKGSSVIGATINQDGILYVKATKVGSDTFLSHIIKLVEEASGTKVPIQKLADKITSFFVPTILVLAILTFIGWFFIGDKSLSASIAPAIAVLVIACPCALGLAVPITLTVGSGIGAKNGILIRKGEVIQTMKEVRIVAFDKTGTITKGKPQVTNVFSLVGEKYLLEIAASLENLSEHPIARAIVDKAKIGGINKFRPVKNFRIVRGKGVEGIIGSKKVIVGNVSLINDYGIDTKKVLASIDNFESDGKTTMIIAENKKVIGAIAVSDAVKDDSVKAISALNQKGYLTVMITGDNERTAKAIAKQVGIKQVVASVLPEDKAKNVEELQKLGKGMVAFVGDGINDAPALKQANVSIAMGTGTDIAIEAGDLVLTSGNLLGVVKAINLSKATFSKIKQNLFWAFAYNVVAIPLAVAGILHPVIAEIAMAASSITVVTNANLLRRKGI